MFSTSGYIILDVGMFIFLILGGLIGYYRGALKATISLLSFYVPYLIYLHFSDQISHYVDLVLDLTQSATTSSIGLLGTFSGLMGGGALFAAFFLAARFFLRLVASRDPELKEKLGGCAIGLFGNQFMAMISLMIVFMAAPAATADTTSKSLWWKVTKPAARLIYPTYESLIYDRTANLRQAIAEDGVLKGLLKGNVSFDAELDGITDIIEAGVENADLISADIIENLKTIDIDALYNDIENLREQGLTAEDIDQRIREEDARRRQFIDDGLSGSQQNLPKSP